MKGRKPTPAHLQLLRGNPSKRPIPPEIEPERSPNIPEPPAFLMPAAKTEWRRLAAGLHHMGLLSLGDEHPFAAYCQAYARWVGAGEAAAQFGPEDSEWRALVRVERQAGELMLRVATEFGMTPSARRRVSAGPTEARSKFAGLIAGLPDDPRVH